MMKRLGLVGLLAVGLAVAASIVLAQAPGIVQLFDSDVIWVLRNGVTVPANMISVKQYVGAGGGGGTTGGFAPTTFYVKNFGGVCNGSQTNATADTAAINKMFAAVRAMPNNTSHPVIDLRVPVDPVTNQNACVINSTINATSASNGVDALSSQNKLIIMGGRLECYTTGTPCFDMSGSVWFHFIGLTINSPSGATESSYGLQIARIHLLQGAGAHTFENVTVQGFYTRAAVMDFASEENVWLNPQIANNDTLNTTSNYTFIDDGCNHFNVKSAFQNIDIPVSNVTSYVQQTFLGGSITSGSNQPNMIAPIFMCGTLNHQWKNVYIHAASQYAVHYFGIGSGNPMQSDFDLHVEGSVVSTFLFENNSSPTQTYIGFKFKDHSTNASASILSNAGHTPMTTITIHNFDIDIGRMGQGPTVQLFDNPAVYSVDGGTIRLPQLSNWQPPTSVNWINGSYSSETVCIQDQVAACESGGSQAPIINRNPDFLIDQAYEGAVETPTNGAIVVDGWREEDSQTFPAGQPMTFNQGNNAIPSRPFVSWYSLLGAVVQSKPPAPGDFYDIYTTVDGADMTQLRWGWGAQGQPVILEYCAQSTIGGITLPIYLASVHGAAGTNHYYNLDDTITAVNSWQCFMHLIPGDQTGTTIWSGVPNQASLRIGVTMLDGASDPTCVDGVWQTSGIVCRSTPASSQIIANPGLPPNNLQITLSYFHLYRGFSRKLPLVDTYSEQLVRAQRWYRKSLRTGYQPGVTIGGQPGTVQFTLPYPATTNGRATTRVDWPNMFTNRLTVPASAVAFYSPVVAGSSKCYNYTQARESGAALALSLSETGMLVQCALVAGDAAGDVMAVHYAMDSGY